MAAPNGITSLYVHPGTLNVGIGTSNPRAKLEVAGSILPSSNMAYDIGSSNLRFRDIFLSGNTIDLGGTAITRDANTGGIKVSDPASGGAPLDLTVKNLVASNVSVIGDFVTLNTVTSNTEQVVVTNAGTGPALKVTQTGANSIAEFYDDGGVLALKVADGGNVGIGTALPQALLDIKGSALIGDTGSAGFYNSNAVLHIRKTLTPHLLFENINQNTGAIVVNGTAGFVYGIQNGGHSFKTGCSYNGDFTLTGTEQMRITADGNVGIGATNPQTKLHVSGSMLIDIYGAQEQGIFFRNGFTSTNKYNCSIMNYDHSSAGASPDGISINGYDGVSICTGAASRNERLRVVQDGNVGIGTATPQSKLHIQGDLLTSGNITNGGFDFRLGYADQSTRGNSGFSRALVKLSGSVLAINYAGDFTGGTYMYGNTTIAGTQTISNGDNSITQYGPNTTWASYLSVGAGGSKINSTTAQCISTNGNLHIDCATGRTTYVNYYSGISTVYKPGGGSFTDSSDSRIKTSIGTISNALQKFLSLRGVQYNWIYPQHHQNKTDVQYGFIAQEYETILPHSVSSTSSLNEDEEALCPDGIKSLNINFDFHALTVEALRELHNNVVAENRILKDKIDSLESRLKQLENKFT